ncbi:MAG TPA: L,D-transpeptidase family protein [Chitinophagales bacterium]|nr:L,D-transpeptidase family protein [Chitinophagales bacterium]HRG87236.1 L,D-transpeptidase family protein [Chitinophagales bacterium]HRH53927.1 L,D-transpeptidase family protein [Chitinophagales bacterium]
MFNKFAIILIIFGMGACNKPKNKPAAAVSYPVNGLQLIVVQTHDWSTTSGTMQLLERADTASDWRVVDTFDVMVGRNGMARDKNSSWQQTTNDPIKQEGDGCAPSGIFSLGPVFSNHALDNLNMPFKQVNKSDLCVDDINSKYYNTLIDVDTILEKDFNSFEYMRRDDHQYEYGVWVHYNTNPQVPGNGSCIFLHIYKTPNTPTSGCTAMSKENMLKLIHWLNASKNPMLIQYPIHR